MIINTSQTCNSIQAYRYGKSFTDQKEWAHILLYCIDFEE